MSKVKITRNYQVTIPEDVRRKVKLNEGDTLEVDALDSQHVILKRIIPLEELKGAWAKDRDIDNAMQEVNKLWKNWKIAKRSA
jgi:antitoxin PrlF